MRDLMIILQNGVDEMRIPLHTPPWIEEGLLQAIALKHLKNAGHRDLVISQPGQARHHGVGAVRVGKMKDAVRIDIEGDRDSTAGTIGPFHRIVDHDCTHYVTRCPILMSWIAGS
jgi:hypothetical protein